MKVKFTNKDKRFISVAQLPIVKRVIAEMKDDTGIMEYAQMAAHIASETNEQFEILKAEAHICKYYNVWNRYFDGSEDLDVYLDIYAFNAS